MNGQGSEVGMVIKLEAIKFCVRVPAEKRDFLSTLGFAESPYLIGKTGWFAGGKVG
jgi:hypothetical protein